METWTEFNDNTLLQPIISHKDKSFEEFIMQTVYPNSYPALKMCRLTSMGTCLRIIDNSSRHCDALRSITIELRHQYMMTQAVSHTKAIIHLLIKHAKKKTWKNKKRISFVLQYSKVLIAITNSISHPYFQCI